MSKGDVRENHRRLSDWRYSTKKTAASRQRRGVVQEAGCRARDPSSVRVCPESSSSPQLLDIEKVLLPAACEFVPDQVLLGNHIDFHFSIEEALNSVLPSLVESETIDALQDVHARRGLADLEC